MSILIEKKKLVKSKKKENDRTTRQSAVKAALKVLENFEHPNICATARSFGVAETTLRRAIKNNGILKRPGPQRF